MKDNYKKTKLGCIPKEWEVVRLEKHIDLLSGFAFKSDSFNEDGKGIKLLRGINISKGYLRWNEKIDKYWDEPFRDSEKFYLKENDLVISMDGSLVGRNFARVSKEYLPLLLVQRVACIRGKKTLNLDYLHQIISSNIFLKYVDAVKTSSGIPHISSKQIKNFTICFPPLPEQQKIAKILSTIDAKLNNISDRITATQTLKKGLMQQLLTEGIGHSEFKDSKLGRIPKSWETVKLYDLRNKDDRYSFTGGPFGSDLKSEHYADKGVQVIQLQNIGAGKFIQKSYVYVSEEKADELNSCNIFPDDIILAKMFPVARCCKIPNTQDRFVMCSDGIRLSIDRDKYHNDYIFHALNTSLFRDLAEAKSTGTTRSRIGLTDLKQILVRIPPLSEQKKIASILSKVDEKLRVLAAQRTEYGILKKGMMQVLLTGEVRVN
jgi:type I restriction enzyme S subunit